jgi:hypothetical protein
MKVKLALVIAAMVALTAACVAPGASAAPTTNNPTASSLPPSSAPGATDLVAVSASSPDPAAAKVLERCNIALYGTDHVSGMGMISKASDLPHYVSLTGREPVLSFDGPAWIVAFKGQIAMPKLNEIWIDPVCVVVDSPDAGLSGFYATGGWVASSGEVHTPLPAILPPDRPLPSLSP